MNTLKILGLQALFLSLTPLISITAQAEEQKWEEIYTEDGIVVSRSEVPGSNLFAFRGEGDVNAPMPKVLGVLRDIKRSSEWVDQFVEMKSIAQINDLERLEYYHAAVPWPFQDRDFLYQTKIEVDRATKTISLSSVSAEDVRVPPVSGLVRGHIFKTRLVLTPIENGTKTHAIGEAHMDPKGALPTWIVNLVQKKWPYNTFMNVRKQVTKPDITDDPLALDVLTSHAPNTASPK